VVARLDRLAVGLQRLLTGVITLDTAVDSGYKSVYRCIQSLQCSVVDFIRLQVYAYRPSYLLGENDEKLLFLAYNIRLFQKIDVSVSLYD